MNRKPAIQIRRAIPSDASSIASVLYEAFVEFEPLYTHEAFCATAVATDIVGSRMREGPIWVASLDGTTVGTVAAIRQADCLYIRGMGVVATARGQGIGEMLLEEAEAFARDGGHQNLRLSTTPFLTAAIRLYEHFGFKQSANGHHELFGTPLFTMEKVLQQSS